MNNNVKKLVFSAIMVALGVILMYVDFPVLPVAPWLKIDFSFLPILIVALAFGTKDAFFVTFAISLINYLLKGDSTGLPIGEIANIISVMSFLLVFVYFKKQGKTIIGAVMAVVSVTIILVIANYTFITPWYFSVLDYPLPDNFLMYTITVIGLFNLIKWSIIGVAAVLVEKTIDKFVDKVK